MKLQLTTQEIAFRDEVRTFLHAELDRDVSRKVKLGYPIARDEQDDWTRKLNAKGWAAPNWPVEAGGPGWSMVRRHLFDIEMKLHHAHKTRYPFFSRCERR